VSDKENLLEYWLRSEVLEGHREYLADSTKGVLADELLDRIKARRAAPEGK